MTKQDIYVVGAARTAIGSFGGGLKDVPLAQLGTTVIKAAVGRAGVDAARIDHVVMGNVIPTEPRDAYLSRVAAMGAGIPQETPAFNVNRLCGSGLQAIVSAAQTILLGDAQVAVGAGAEAMSRGPYLLPALRWGARMGETAAVDYMVGILTDPFDKVHMGITAENVAARFGITRQMQDELAVTSQQRAARAIAEGRFREQIVPVVVQTRKGPVEFATDENVRADVTIEQLAKMKPAFKPDGVVTAGNASSINDGAAAVAIVSDGRCASLRLKPLARIIAGTTFSQEPEWFTLAPIGAIKRLLDKINWPVDSVDLFEINEAFAAVTMAAEKELHIPAEKVNIYGGAVALGHPIGASGARILVTLLTGLARTGGQRGVACLCIGGGEAVALAVETFAKN